MDKHSAGSTSAAPEKTVVKIGFIALTDCASVVMAASRGFDKKHGIRIVLSREASWAAIRDKLISGELDAAHVLYGLVYGVHMGIGGPKKDMAVLMTLNNNGQAITLSNQLRDKGVSDGASLSVLMQREPRRYTFAQTFPTGTHAMWLYYWLAANGIHPLLDSRIITVPPPQMVANMKAGNMDGYCAGEPWNARAVADKVGFTAITSQEIWPDHPEKVLGTTADFAERHANTARAMTAAVLEASRYLDASPAHRQEAAELLAGREFVDTDPEVILERMQGRYSNGLGLNWSDTRPMKFFDEGVVNFPYLSDGMWFLTQQRRWGMLAKDPDYLAVARQINRTDIYSAAASAADVALPLSAMRSSRLMDGVTWNGSDPAGYAQSFAIKAEALKARA